MQLHEQGACAGIDGTSYTLVYAVIRSVDRVCPRSAARDLLIGGELPSTFVQVAIDKSAVNFAQAVEQ
jgi:hypothetical protein